MSCTFATFAEEVRRKNLTPRDCGNNHWRILGGTSGVNFYPSTKRGSRMHIDGAKSGSRHSVTVADAIAAANAPPPKTKTRHCRTRDRERSPEQDAGSNETRNKGDAMNAEEFGVVVKSIADAILDGGPRTMLETLKDVYIELDQHWLEMVAAERKVPTYGQIRDAELRSPVAETMPAVSGIATIATESRLDRIEKRLGEIERITNLAGRALRSSLDSPCSPLASGRPLDAAPSTPGGSTAPPEPLESP